MPRVALLLAVSLTLAVAQELWMNIHIDFSRTELCKNQGLNQIIFNYRVQRKGRHTSLLGGNVTFKIPYSDDITMRLVLGQEGGGGWKRNSIVVVQRQACSSYSSINPGWKELRDHTDIPPGCPVPAGTYVLRDYDSSVYDKMKIPKVPLGKWRATFIYIQESTGKRLGCHRMYATATKK